MSLLKTNEIQNYNGSSLTLTASTVSTSAQLNTGGNISVTGSLNVSDDSTTRTNLGLGTMATQNANAVALTGGSITGTTIVPTTPFSFRNRIINGDMRIDQRNAGGSTTISAYGYGIDRWGYQCFGGGAWSSQRTTVVPSGHGNSLGLTVTTADGSIGSTDVYQLFQKVEGFNAADLGFGTANAKTITVSFWVRSSITGTYSASFQNNGFNRGYVATFEVNAADTWEYKTLTVIGDTSGTWTIDNSVGLQLAIDLGSGSGSNITAGSWQTVTTSSLRTNGSVDWVGTNGATFYITGVQLEEGTVATPFEHRPYGMELNLCERYFETMVFGASRGITCQARSATDTNGWYSFRTRKRVIPTVSASGTFGAFTAGAATNSATLSFSSNKIDGVGLDVATSGMIAGNASLLVGNTEGTILISAEL